MNTDSQSKRNRIVILGGGFGGAYTARHLEKICQGRPDVEIVLVSHNNFLLMTPLLFEVCSGTLDERDCAFPIRAFLHTTCFAEATVQRVDLERRVVHLAGGSETGELVYDQLVLALGAIDKSANDSRLRARAHVQDACRRPAAPQPNHRKL